MASGEVPFTCSRMLSSRRRTCRLAEVASRPWLTVTMTPPMARRATTRSEIARAISTRVMPPDRDIFALANPGLERFILSRPSGGFSWVPEADVLRECLHADVLLDADHSHIRGHRDPGGGAREAEPQDVPGKLDGSGDSLLHGDEPIVGEEVPVLVLPVRRLPRGEREPEGDGRTELNTASREPGDALEPDGARVGEDGGGDGGRL